MKLLDQVYSKYKKSINMTFRELKAWQKNKLSKEAPRKPIKINLELMQLPKSKWNIRHLKNAMRIISFIKRTKLRKAGKKIKGQLSKKTITLMNYGFNPNK